MDLQMQEADISGYIPNGEWDLVGKPRKDMRLATLQEATFIPVLALKVRDFSLCVLVSAFIDPCSNLYNLLRAIQ